jgi:transcriptional regulator of acetoin/glycerol metabolism
MHMMNDAHDELMRLLPRLGLAYRVTSTGLESPLCVEPNAAHPSMLRVEFAMHFAASANPSRSATIEFATDADFAACPINLNADFICDNAIAAACFILSRALGLPSVVLTRDEQFFAMIRAALALARDRSGIMVEGEIGVGKASLIKLIHAASDDPRDLIYAECAAVDASRVDAEVVPLLAQASGTPSPVAEEGLGEGGTIFFNHIDELSLIAQARLLLAIRSASGLATSRTPARASVRVLAASRRPLAAMVACGGFLRELHELFDTTFTIAPLRDRAGDVPMLVSHFLRALGPGLTLDAGALRMVSRYPFPGNLRELINFVTRIAIVPASPSTARSGSDRENRAIGRAEVIRQLDQPSLDSTWRPSRRLPATHTIARSKASKRMARLEPLDDLLGLGLVQSHPEVEGLRTVIERDSAAVAAENLKR